MLMSVALCCGGCLDVLETHLRKKSTEKLHGSLHLWILDSRAPKPNLSNRGTTLLLLMLQRGTKIRVIALRVFIRIRNIS